jgi:hypothetical protein
MNKILLGIMFFFSLQVINQSETGEMRHKKQRQQ